MTLLPPPAYVNVIASVVYNADLPAPLFQTYCRIAGLAWRDKQHQWVPLTTIPELAIYLHCTQRSVWGHLIALRKRGLISWTTTHGVIQIRLKTACEAPVSLQNFAVTDGADSLQNFAVPNDHVVVDQDQESSVLIQQQQSSDQSDLLQTFAVTDPPDSLQTFAVTTNLSALQKFAVDLEAAEAQAVAALPHVTPELIHAWGEYLRQQPQVYNLPGLLLYTLRTTQHRPRPDQRGGARRKTAPSEQPELPVGVATALPDVIQGKLDHLGWNDDTAEIAAAYQHDPERVHAWLDYALAQTNARSRAGLFRKGLRSTALPPTAQAAATVTPTTSRYTTDEFLFAPNPSQEIPS